MQTISMKAPRNAAIGQALRERLAKCSTLFFAWSRRKLAARNILRFLFAENTCYAVMGVVGVVMWYHIAMIADDAAAGRQVALDALFLLPPMAAMAIRSLSRKGGEA